MSFPTLDAAPLLSALALVILAVAHSVLGERDILQPLFRASESSSGDVHEPEQTLTRNRILQFAWHLTSMAWLALAAIAVGLDPSVSVAIVCFGSAGLIFWSLRRHLAWPIFLIAGFAALSGTQALSSEAARGLGWLAIAALVACAILHLYWVAGGRWLIDEAIPTQRSDPTSEPDPTFRPPRWMTLAVAVALFGESALLGFGYRHVGLGPVTPQVIRAVAWAGVLLLVARAIGDRKYIGFFKSVRDTVFGQADDQYFTPLITIIAL